MPRRPAAIALATAFLMHATGLTLTAHLHECDDQHDAQQCSACHMLVGNSSIPPTQPDSVNLGDVSIQTAERPGDAPCLNRFKASCESPRAPPLA